MTSTTEPVTLAGCDDPASVLAHARARKQAEDDAARDVLRVAVRFAAMRSEASLVGPADGWHEAALPLGGEGCPEVAEFAVTEFAAAMERSTEWGRRYLAHAMEGCYRLGRCWARMEAGDLEARKLGFIAERTLPLPPEAAGFVDRHPRRHSRPATTTTRTHLRRPRRRTLTTPPPNSAQHQPSRGIGPDMPPGGR